MSTNIKKIKSVWKEGKYFDAWVLVHLLSGIVGGTFLLIIEVPELYAWITCSIIAIIWEIGEWKYKITESVQNWLLDIVYAFLGVLIGYKYLHYLNYDQTMNMVIFVVEIAILAPLATVGWKRYFKYKK